MNCRGCGVVLEPSEEQVNTAVDQILHTSLEHARDTGGVCPLCGHSKAIPNTAKKSVLFAMLLACLAALCVVILILQHLRQTDRAAVTAAAISQINANPTVSRIVGVPVSASQIEGDVRQDETGWKEARLTFSINGPRGNANVHVIADKAAGSWSFTTFEIDFQQQHQRLDLISGRIVDDAPGVYVDVHTQAAKLPESSGGAIPLPQLDGAYPCVFANVAATRVSPALGKCTIPVGQEGNVDRFEADFRDGNFVMRETDLRIYDVFDVPLTRSYRSRNWAANNPAQAFGRNTSHPYDIAPVGTRNPYTWQLLVLEDGEFLYFNRISQGTGYSDALYMHAETSTRFYKATQQWNGNGWTMKLADGSEILFPESYLAKNMAQGAPVEMRDPHGNRLQLIRDAQRNLKEIRTPHGHWIKFDYDQSSRITRAATDAGDSAQYLYNADGMLTTVSYSNGQQRHYQYQNALMTQVSDQAGRILVQNTFDRGLLKQQKFEDGSTFSYSYDWNPASTFPDRVQITLPDQTVKELSVANSVPDFVRNYRKYRPNQ